MVKVILTHLYVIIMAILVVTTGNILADHFGNRIINSIHGLISDTDHHVDQMHDQVKDWNKKILN